MFYLVRLVVELGPCSILGDLLCNWGHLYLGRLVELGHVLFGKTCCGIRDIFYLGIIVVELGRIS